MDTENPSAPLCAKPPVAARKHPNRGSGGLLHDNARHTSHFVVIGNHLAQHPTLSALAIGLGVHIQSLPKGAQVDIKSLTARFPEGRDRIGAALRELEAHGYLRRERERVSDGRIITRTVSCNRPGHRTAPTETPDRPGRRTTAATAATAATDKPPRLKRLPAVPRPSNTSPALLRTALDILAGLHRRDPRLLLSAADAEHLAPGVAAWLERDVAPTVVRDALAANLPAEPLIRPAAFLAHRLAAQLPPPPPFRPPAAPAPQPRHPFQNCDGCDRPFRAATPGRCRDCRSDLPAAA
ncbi:helix-turn-helix domain-containing protein [Streptomyces fuscichromogenes]|uniref:DNA-binding protein n=1 Tax=Streptomyces fuscichromogenes TaxID=1324013 RepID=A0A917XHI8_9ACTN|nr:helix-turn-helix domain-containing protein [Streptomyces fuscichromogenes]GGN26481.1 DNA-binding protein [Streptomyces fuscichromogenes]